VLKAPFPVYFFSTFFPFPLSSTFFGWKSLREKRIKANPANKASEAQKNI
jgi:hypothetical protein